MLVLTVLLSSISINVKAQGQMVVSIGKVMISQQSLGIQIQT